MAGRIFPLRMKAVQTANGLNVFRLHLRAEKARKEACRRALSRCGRCGATSTVCIFVRKRSGAETLYIRASDEHVHPVAAGMLRGLQRVGVAGFKVDAGPVAYMVDFLVLGVVLMNNQLGIADHNMI